MKKSLRLLIVITFLLCISLSYSQDTTQIKGNNTTQVKGDYNIQYAFSQNFAVSPYEKKIISMELPNGTTAIIYRITVGKKNQTIGNNLVDAISSIPDPYAATASAFAKLAVSLCNYEATYYVFSKDIDATYFKSGKAFTCCKTTGETTSATVKMLSNNCFGTNNYLYFGFTTPEMLIDYYVTLEVIPWVEEQDLGEEKEISGGVNEKTVEQKKGLTYSDLGNTAYENGDTAKAFIYFKKAIELDSTLTAIYPRLGLLFLIRGDEMTATDYYVTAISYFKNDITLAKFGLQVSIMELNNALKKYPTLKNYKNILDLLQSEYNKL